MVTRKYHRSIPMQQRVVLFLCHNLLLSDLLLLVSSQTVVSSDQCLSAPCDYVAECRDQTGTCGDTPAHCNSESTWVPACGGGGGMYKPSTMDATGMSSPAPMIATESASAPLMMPTTSSSAVPTQTQREFTTEEPTTAWEAWISGESDQNKGVIGLTTGNEGGGNYTQSNGTESWFNGDTWQKGRNKTNEDQGLLDKIDFWSNSDSSSSGREYRSGWRVLWPLTPSLLFYGAGYLLT